MLHRRLRTGGLQQQPTQDVPGFDRFEILVGVGRDWKRRRAGWPKEMKEDEKAGEGGKLTRSREAAKNLPSAPLPSRSSRLRVSPFYNHGATDTTWQKEAVRSLRPSRRGGSRRCSQHLRRGCRRTGRYATLRFQTSPSWWNGRHRGLKIPFPKGSAGSTPADGTTFSGVSGRCDGCYDRLRWLRGPERMGS